MGLYKSEICVCSKAAIAEGSYKYKSPYKSKICTCTCSLCFVRALKRESIKSSYKYKSKICTCTCTLNLERTFHHVQSRKSAYFVSTKCLLCFSKANKSKICKRRYAQNKYVQIFLQIGDLYLFALLCSCILYKSSICISKDL